jgi:RimJ/RimL family protein N-acetyltransferase
MTDGIRLREVLNDDLPIFYEQQLEPEATEMAAFPSRGKREFMAHWTNNVLGNEWVKKTILFEGQVAGNVVSFEQDGKMEVGYWLGKEFWGQGIASRALAEFLGYVVVRPLYAHVAKHNIASRRVLEKCGFTIHGLEFELADTGDEPVGMYILKLE